MNPVFKRVVFTDEWICPDACWLSRIMRHQVSPLHWILLPLPRKPCEFPNYALGYRFEASDRELRLIEANQFYAHIALQLHDNFHPLTFADVLGPEFVPEVNPSEAELLRVEARVRESAAIWTHFFESMPD